MVFKGFTDENGNVIPVQGAGTVYNEEKNSLALGKDTSAVGQDQFVFGRSNVEDADKAEIVGGGSYLNALNGLEINGTFRIDNPTSSDVIAFVTSPYSIEFTPVSAIFKKVANGKDAASAALVSMYDASSMKSTSLFNTWAEGKTDIHAFEVTFVSENGTEASYDGLFLTDGIGNDYWVAYKLSIDYSGALNAQVISQQRVTGGLKHKFNIRTLDWAGNEKLACSLTVGTGITIGETSLSETELIALKALLNT